MRCNWWKTSLHAWFRDIKVTGSVCTDRCLQFVEINLVYLHCWKRRYQIYKLSIVFFIRLLCHKKSACFGISLGLKKTLSTWLILYCTGSASGLNHCIFRSLTKDLGSEHSVLLSYTEVNGHHRPLFWTAEEIKVYLKECECDLVWALESRKFK